MSGFERYAGPRRSRSIPWRSLGVGDVWLCIGRTSRSLKSYALKQKPKEFSCLEAINGTVLKRDS